MTGDQIRSHVATFVAQLLDVPVDRVQSDVPLDHLGFDSATSLVLAADLSALLGREISPIAVFDSHTIDVLASRLAAAS